jgi:hypothetical protein
MDDKEQAKHSKKTLVIGWLGVISCSGLAVWIIAFQPVHHEIGVKPATIEIPAFATAKVVIPPTADSLIMDALRARTHIDRCTAIGKVAQQFGINDKDAGAALYQNRLISLTPGTPTTELVRFASIRDIMFGWVNPGMTECEAIAAIGFPSDINRTRTSNRESEQWVYETHNGRIYLYLEEGIVRTVQD